MKSVQKVIGGVLATAFVFLSGTVVSLAWVPEGGGDGQDDLIGWIRAILMFIVGLAGLIAVAILIFNGIKYMTASGDEQKIQSATSGITWAVIGLVVVGIAWLIVNFVINRIIQMDPDNGASVTHFMEFVSRMV